MVILDPMPTDAFTSWMGLLPEAFIKLTLLLPSLVSFYAALYLWLCRLPLGNLLEHLWSLLHMISVYLTLLPQGLIVLLGNGLRGKIVKYFFATLLISTLAITIVAFTTRSGDVDFANQYYGITSSSLNLLKMAGYVIITIVMDALIVFRTFVIWNRSWKIIIVPGVLLCADTAKSIWYICTLSLSGSVAPDGVDSPRLQLVSFFALIWGLNVICTGLIAFKIGRSQWVLNKFKASGDQRLRRAFSLIIESAAIYSLLLFVALILAIAGSNGLYIVFDMLPPMIGIIFLYVILRGSKNNQDTTNGAITTGNSTFTNISSIRHTPRLRTSIDLEYPSETHASSLSPASIHPIRAESVQVHVERTHRVRTLNSPISDSRV
ncbi:unnamed protein product [Somion occarium]|uniref:Uncharacterized protein n=1 Tax=Somion occarium TaxID=3059160 RepID=A0ABP1D8F0_9APHY